MYSLIAKLDWNSVEKCGKMLQQSYYDHNWELGDICPMWILLEYWFRTYVNQYSNKSFFKLRLFWLISGYSGYCDSEHPLTSSLHVKVRRSILRKTHISVFNLPILVCGNVTLNQMQGLEGLFRHLLQKWERQQSMTHWVLFFKCALAF